MLSQPVRKTQCDVQSVWILTRTAFARCTYYHDLYLVVFLIFTGQRTRHFLADLVLRRRRRHGLVLSGPEVKSELWYSHTYPCPRKFYKLPAVTICSTHLFYKLSRAWAWLWMSQPSQVCLKVFLLRHTTRHELRSLATSAALSDQGGNTCHNPDFLGFSKRRLVLGLLKTHTWTNVLLLCYMKGSGGGLKSHATIPLLYRKSRPLSSIFCTMITIITIIIIICSITIYSTVNVTIITTHCYYYY